MPVIDFILNRIRARLQLVQEARFLRGLSRLGVEVGKGVRIYGRPIVSMVPGSRISIEDGVVLCSDSRFTALGVTRPVILRTINADAFIRVGSQTGLSGTVICAARSVSVGSECLVGSNVLIVDTDFHPLAPDGRRHSDAGIIAAPVVIEDNVFVGSGSMVLRGVTIGQGSVIGAGSIVTRSVPARAVAAGNPARTLRSLDAARASVPNER